MYVQYSIVRTAGRKERRKEEKDVHSYTVCMYKYSTVQCSAVQHTTQSTKASIFHDNFSLKLQLHYVFSRSNFLMIPSCPFSIAHDSGVRACPSGKSISMPSCLSNNLTIST